MRALVTGASGFAGRWLVRACLAAGDTVVGLSRSGELPDAADATDDAVGVRVDLTDRPALERCLGEAEPEVVYHLAALSHVGRSWEDPATTLEANTLAAVNLLEAIRQAAPEARVVWASSCEVYGSRAELPVTEDAPLNPVNPYAVSKATGDMLAGVYAEAYGLHIVRARPFNHAGPGQLPIFIVSSLAEQAARARHDGAERLRLVTGNPETRRDFTDVRDVVRAYRMLASPDVAPGIYNVSTGTSISAGEQVALVADLLAPIEVEHVIDPARVRAHEVLDHRGSSERLRSATGWRPEIPFHRTMADTIAWWEMQLSCPRRRN